MVSPHMYKKELCEVMGALTIFIVVIILQYVHVSNHHTAHLKLTCYMLTISQQSWKKEMCIYKTQSINLPLNQRLRSFYIHTRQILSRHLPNATLVFPKIQTFPIGYMGL